MSIPIAGTAEELTPAWLTDALQASGTVGAGTTVTAATVTPVGTGQMCDSVRIALTYDGPEPGPDTLVAKLPASDPTSRATAQALRNYELEVRFYQELAPSLPVRTPHCHHADIAADAGSFILLLEDMAPASQGDQLLGCTPDEAAVAVAELPALHAPRWGDPTLAHIPWLHRDPEASRSITSELLPALHTGFRERYADQLDEEVTTACDLLFPRLGEHVSGHAGPVTIVHGDYRLDNLLFGGKDGGVPITVVDWQTVSTGSALTDVAYFLGAGLRPDDRRAHERALVEDYLGRLTTAGVEGYGWDDCWTDYRRGTWSGLIMAVAASMLVERTARGDEMFLTMARRHARHALDLDAAALLGT